ncbi:helix-turn-helix domain-containing protein [Actinoallomurus sp. CA-150999]|uniref:helix-turn-helix domain-containing protein n=1 Tax=Actinoallomurus sp. CA-150999 TaxID=3239887 RepID=UPI003D8DFDC0
MPTRESPTLRRRRLAQQLRSLRDDAGMKSAEVAARLEWAPSKLTRMERNEGKRYDVNDIALLCEIYGTDDLLREHLMQLARDGRKKGWWDPYHAWLSEELSNYIGLEAEAASVLAFEPLIVPGLLQTPEYARAIIGGGRATAGGEQVDAKVEIRMRRQEALHNDPALRVIAVMDEAALHRRVGSNETMRAQFDHLQKLTRLPNVTLHVIPFEAGVHPSVSGSFNILQFPEPTDRDAVYVDLLVGQMFLEEPEEVGAYHDAFISLVGQAANPSVTLTMLAERSSH